MDVLPKDLNASTEGSEGEASDDGLQIVLESPIAPKLKKKPKENLNESDKQIIACVEKDLEDTLEKKAAKANLNANHVKNILKHVVTNEHVLALLRHAENPEENKESVPVYEPKYTRAKTKELLLSTNVQHPVIPWAATSSPKSPSAVQVLFSEELQEDDSGDEYVPKQKTEDVSSSKSKDKKANIALRTRSKLSLSHTPLEAIEQSFMPPDITTDMYDMDCDDDLWRDFLKTYTKPLDEVAKATEAEDEDQDPEYNILADEEIDKVDKEELRADRAVTVSRKELNALMAELFEYADIYESNNVKDTSQIDLSVTENEETVQNNSDPEDGPNITIKKCQIPLLAQQMRQHVQMLTHNFILCYEHPEFSYMAPKFKECLVSLQSAIGDKRASMFYTVNLFPALKLIEEWENLFASNSNEVQETKLHVNRVIVEMIQAKQAGNFYVPTFPPLVMETISKSDVFIYPNLLPRIPPKSINVLSKKYSFTQSEENLMVLFMEQVIPQLKQDKYHMVGGNRLNMRHLYYYLHTYLMPWVSPLKIEKHIRKRKNIDLEENAIKTFFTYKKVPPIVHYVYPLDSFGILPPCKRSPEALPLLWRQYNFPNAPVQNQQLIYTTCNNVPLIVVPAPVNVSTGTGTKRSSLNYNINFHKRSGFKRKLHPKGPLPPIINKRKRKKRDRKSLGEKFHQINQKVLVDSNIDTEANMLRDMPILGGTPVKNQHTDEQLDPNASKETEPEVINKPELSFQNVQSFEFPYYKPGEMSSNNSEKRNFEIVSELASTSTQDGSSKDDPEDINKLMMACTTVKTAPKKEPSGAEKKRAKMRREFLANLAMASADSLATQLQNDEILAENFFLKLKDILEPDDYDKLIDILGHFEEGNRQFCDLYKNVQSILLPKYPDLSDEFLLFLTDFQANKVGKLMPYFMMKDMARFMKKLQVYFKDQPSQMKKIIKAFTDLTESSDLTMDTIKETILPLLKGNVALTEWFLQTFSTEKPPSVLLDGPYELVDVRKELLRPPDEEIYETVAVPPDTEDPYGGSSCICACHNVETTQCPSPPLQHCTKCGLKFIQGKLFIQTGKGLRPAVVSFLTNPRKNHAKRLSAVPRKRSDTSPSKQTVSPNKDHGTNEEAKIHNNENGDVGVKKKCRQRKTRKRKVKEGDNPCTSKEGGKANKEISNKQGDKTKSDKTTMKSKTTKRPAKKRVSKKSVEQEVQHKPGSSCGQQKRPAEEEEEALEAELMGPAELVHLKVSSDHSGESESEFFESSQDITNTDSDDLSDECSSSSQPGAGPSWSREEDKIILQAFKQRSDNEETFNRISQVLQNRSVTEIKNRFHKLMSLLHKMAAKSS